MIQLGLLGYPLLKSLSPRLHGAALFALGLPGEYSLFPLAPGDSAGLQARLQAMRQGDLHGLNVTIPYKQTVIPYLDRLTPLATLLGAVNTIFSQDGVLVGDNTDAPGFFADLQHLFPALFVPHADDSPPQALVLGAGGAARAVAFVLALAGWRITIAARRREQAQALADALSAATPHLAPQALRLDEVGQAAQRADLLVNASAAGMLPNSDTSPWPAGVALPAQAHVYDLVYKPPETRFLQQARQAGLPAANGVGMLVEQAALAMERWVGRPVPRRAMWDAIPEHTANILGAP